MIEVVTVKSTWDREESLHFIHHDTEVLDPRARLAASLIERWGMVAAEPGPEDSAGRQTMDLMSVRDVVDRACQAADQAYDRFYALGWVTQAPTYAEAREALAKKTPETAE